MHRRPSILTVLLPLMAIVACNDSTPGSAVGQLCDASHACPAGFECMPEVGGTTSACASASCSGQTDCLAGYACSASDCVQLCNGHSECGVGSACLEGLCAGDGSPIITATVGNGSTSCTASPEQRCFADGFAVSGHNLADAQFRLEGPSRFDLATAADDTAANSLRSLSLPQTLVAGSYTLVAVNGVGEDQATVTILQGEPGSYTAGTGIVISGDVIRADIGTGVGQVAGGAVVAALEARIATLEAGSGGGALMPTTTLSIGPTGDHASLAAAFIALGDVRIAAAATVTLQLQAGTHTATEALWLDHPDGVRIEIIGDTTTPGNVTLQFNGSTGIAVANATLGFIDGVVIRGNDAANTVGLSASYGAAIVCGPNVTVEGFDSGYYAVYGAQIIASGTSALNNNNYGYIADFGGVIDADGASAIGNGIGGGFVALRNGSIRAPGASASSNVGSGFASSLGGSLDAFNAASSSNQMSGYDADASGSIMAFTATASSNVGDGFTADDNGVIMAMLATSTNNGGSGYVARRGAVIRASDSTATNNTSFGYEAWATGVIDAHNAVLSGNTAGTHSPTVGTPGSDGSYIIP